jgi:hypothetical protein
MQTADETRYATCDGRPLIITWFIHRHLFWTFEIDTDEVDRLLPEPLQVVEIRPGVALMSVGLLVYDPGQFRPESPVFSELVGAVHVVPDLSVKMPVPNMTFLSFSVLSDSQEFVDQEGNTLYTPTRLAGLRAQLSDDELGVTVSDDEGPILTMPSEHPEPRWVLKEMWGQHYTNTRGLQHGIWQWDGRVFEHQKRTRGWKLHPHSFWVGMDLKRVRNLYRTMVHEPGTVCHERFYKMRPLTQLE